MTTVNSVSSTSSNKDTPAKVTSLKDLQAHPEFFPVWMEEIQRKNVANLLTTSQSVGDSSSDQASLFGSDTSSSDPFAALGITGLSSTDSLTGALGSQGLSSDLSFMNPSSALQSYQVNETLQGLQDYASITKAKAAWLNQVITYKDPTDSVVKTGKITRIDIENVNKPTFWVDKVELSLEDIQSLNAEMPSTQTSIA